MLHLLSENKGQFNQNEYSLTTKLSYVTRSKVKMYYCFIVCVELELFTAFLICSDMWWGIYCTSKKVIANVNDGGN